MKKIGFLLVVLIVSMLLAIPASFAGDVGEVVATGGGVIGAGCHGPGCGVIKDGIIIDAKIRDFQDADSSLDGNRFEFTGKQIHDHEATGTRTTPAGSGETTLSSESYYNVTESRDLPDGWTTEGRFKGYKFTEESVALGGSCPTLLDNTVNKTDVIVITDHGQNSMANITEAHGVTKIDLSGQRRSMSYKTISESNTGSFQRGPFGWSGNNMRIKTETSRNSLPQD